MSFELPRSATSSNDVLSTTSLAPVLEEGSLTTSLTGLGRSSQSLLFVDRTVADYQQLVAGVTPGTEIHLLDPVQDAVTQITNTLLGRQNIASLHVVSHGEAGGLDFGSSALNLTDLPQYAAQLKTWSKALTNDADILFYGCNVAQGAVGQTFVQSVSQLTGADVAASDDLTGNAALGGNWELEFETGVITTSLAIEQKARSSYQSTLALLAEYKFDGNTSDTSGNNLNGVLVGDASFSTGKFGQGIALDGNGDYVHANFGNFDLSNFTVEAWVNVPTFNSNVHYLSLFQNASLVLGDYGDGKINTNADGLNPGDAGGSISQPSLSSNAWHHLAFTFDGSTQKIFLDGVLAGGAPTSGTVSLNPSAYNQGLNIGARYTGSFQFVTGVIDNVRIYDQALAPAQLGFFTDNTNPSITVSGTPLSYTENALPTLIDSTATVTDSESTNFDTGTLTVNFSANGTVDDRLLINNQGTATGQIGVSGSNVTFGSTQIGTFTGGVGTTPLVITFNSSSSPTAAQALLRNIGYSNVSDTPTTTARTVSLVITDGDGGTSTTATKTINVTAVDDPPVLTVSDSSTYPTSAAPGLVAPNLTVTDIDSGNLTGAKVSIGSNFDVNDRLAIAGQSGTTGTINGLTWSYATNTGILSLTGAASAATYQTALRQVTYSNTSGTPIQGDRNIQFALGTNLANPNNGHFYEFVNAGGAITWTAASSAAATRNYFGLQGYLVTVTSAAESSFVSSKLQGAGWLGASDAAVEGQWRWVTGPETGQQFWQGTGNGQSVSGRYNNWNSQEPNDSGNEDYGQFLVDGKWNDLTDSVASISGYVVEYGGLAGDPVLQLTGNATVTVTTVNDAPTIALGSVTVVEDIPTAITGITFADVDAGSGNVTATFSVPAGTLAAIASTGVTVTGTSTNLILNGTIADLNALIAANKLTYQTVLNSNTDVTLGISINDNGNTPGPAETTNGTLTINITPVNDAPQGTNRTVSTLEDTAYTFTVADFGFSDPNDTPANNLQAVKISTLPNAGSFTNNGAAVQAGDLISVANITNGLFRFTPTANANGTDYASFTFRVQDNGGTANSGQDTDLTARTLTVNVTPVNDAPSLTANATLTTVAQNTTNPSGSTITSLFGSLFSDPDTGATLNGLAIVGNTANITTQGKWQYLISGTTTWADVGVVADNTTALALSANTLLRFLPVTGYNGTPPSLTVRALDNSYSDGFTTSTTPVRVNTTANGGSTAIAGTTVALNTNVRSLSDLLWRNSGTGQNAVWQLDGFTLQSAYFLPTVTDRNWQIARTADFNHDGFADILWRNQASGENVIWQMNSIGYESSHFITQVPDQNWQIVSTADFNSNGTPDILWRNKATGENSIWEMKDDFTLQAGHFITQVPDQNWQIVSTADFNSNGTPDILWRNKATGENSIWEMKIDFTLQAGHFFTQVPDQNWQIVSTADFNSNGTPDILWRNKATGENTIWEMKGDFTLQAGHFFTQVPDQNWQIAGTDDFNDDGTPDILWRNKQAAKEDIWQMNGFSYAQRYPLVDAIDPNWSVRPFVAA